MSELLDRMLQQFDEMKAIAEANARIANQALDERNRANKALLDCQNTMQAVADGFRGMTTTDFNFGADWPLREQLEDEIVRVKAILEPQPVKLWITP